MSYFFVTRQKQSFTSKGNPTAGLEFDVLQLGIIATTFLGGFLLFTLQPMIARMALPRLGGTPAVWNSAMLSYQLLLLVGRAKFLFMCFCSSPLCSGCQLD
jgi:hypothetical protein